MDMSLMFFGGCNILASVDIKMHSTLFLIPLIAQRQLSLCVSGSTDVTLGRSFAAISEALSLNFSICQQHMFLNMLYTSITLSKKKKSYLKHNYMFQHYYFLHYFTWMVNLTFIEDESSKRVIVQIWHWSTHLC